MIFLLFITLIVGNKSFANNIAAGEVTYTWVSDSTYRVNFKAYFECTGTTEPNTLPLCIVNTCTTISTSGTLTKTTSTTLPQPCPSYPNKCSTPSSTLPGYREVVYSTLVTLSSRCADWRFSVALSNRDAATNLAGSSFYIDASLNNTGSYQGNSSPNYSRIPFEFMCANEPFTYNSIAVDANGDSLVTDIISVKTNSGCSLGTSVALNAATPSYAIPNNPLQTNNSTTCNATNGQIGFTPTQVGNSVMALRTREYRNGVLIGYTTRELRFLVLPCSTPYSIIISPLFQRINFVNGIACPGTTMSYSVIISATDTNAILSVTDNSTNATPGATVTYTHQNTDSVWITYTWPVPSNMAPKLLNTIYTVKDATCQAPGILKYSSYLIPFSVSMNATTVSDSFVCQGQPYFLKGGNNWSIISGPPGSLSCTTCTSPVATPTAKTVYLSSVTACPNLRDTVTIDVKPLTTPTLSVSALPGVNISTGTPVAFTATMTNCTNPTYQWKKNGLPIAGANLPAYASATLANGDIIACQLTCNDTCPSPKVQTQQVTMIVTNGVAKLLSESDIIVSPNPNNGIFTISTQSGKADKYTLKVYNNLGQSVYNKTNIILGNGNSKQIDLSHLPSGIYTLMLNETAYKINISK